MSRTGFRLLVAAAVAMLGMHIWLAAALYGRVDDFIYKWTWIEALIYAFAALVVLADALPRETGAASQESPPAKRPFHGDGMHTFPIGDVGALGSAGQLRSPPRCAARAPTPDPSPQGGGEINGSSEVKRPRYGHAVTFRGGGGAIAPAHALVFILVVAAILRVMLLFAPPLSSDIYRYVWDGRVQAAGINPYRYIPADPALAPLRDAAIYPNINRRTYAHTIYPPVAQIVFFLVTRLGQTVTIMKAAMLGFEALAIWAIVRLLRRLNLPPTRVLLYAWHPLPIWSFACDGHVDAIAVACLALGLLAAQARRPILAGMALGGLLLSKIFPVVVAPALYRRWDWRLPSAFVVTVVVCYLPYLDIGTKVFGYLGGYSKEEGLRDGTGLYLWLVLKYLLPAVPQGWVKLYPLMAALILAAVGLVVALRRTDRDVSIVGALVLALVATMLVSPHYAWYFAWLVVFLVFVPSPGLVWLTAAAAFFEPVEWPGDFSLVSTIYIPFLILVTLEIAWRMVQARRRAHAEPVGLAAG